MQVAIVDDSLEDIQRLQQLLRRYDQETMVQTSVHPYANGRALLDQFEAGRYDICFLDICMDDLDGLSVAEQIRAVDRACLIVFTTSSTEYAADSYRVRAFDYLLKPLSYEVFTKTMALCGEALGSKSRTIRIKCGWTYEVVAVRDIVFTDYTNHYVYFHMKRGHEKPLRTASSFADFAPTLLAYPQFLNCSRNVLINMDEVARMNADSFTMSTGVTIPMWRNRKAELRQRYAEYQFRKMNGGCQG